MKKTKTKSALLLSIVSIIVCFAMLAGTTAAWFTDSVSNTGNRIQAGTLKIDLLMDKDGTGNYTSIRGGSGDIFDEATKANNSNATLWEPGKTQFAYLAVKNLGNLALKYNIVLDVVDRETNEDLSVPMAGAFTYAVINGAKASDLAGKTKWSQIEDLAVSPIGYKGSLLTAIHGQKSGRITVAENGKMDEILEHPDAQETQYFVLAIHMNEDAGNAYQNGLIEFDVNLVATQLNAELDGFNNPDYDSPAIFPSIAKRIEGKATTGKIAVNNENKISGEWNPTSGEEEQFIEVKSSATSGSVDVLGSAQIPVAAVNNEILDGASTPKASVISQMQSLVQAAPETGFDVSDEIVLTLNVNTKSATTDSVALDVTMSGEITRTIVESGNVENQTIEVKEKDIKELAAPVIVNIDLEAGLSEVSVTHTHEGEAPVVMTRVENLSELEDGKFHYDRMSGKLSLKTSRFSEFSIQYTREDVIENKEKGKTYPSLADAFKEAKVGETIKVLKDTDVPATVVKNITLDVNGKSVSNVLVINDATLTVKGGGRFAADTNSAAVININEGSYDAVVFGGEGTVNITGGVYKQLGKAGGSTVNVKVTGGKFVDDPKPYLSDDSCEKFVDNFYYVGHHDVVFSKGKDECSHCGASSNAIDALIGDKYYGTIKNAISEYKDSDVITLAFRGKIPADRVNICVAGITYSVPRNAKIISNPKLTESDDKVDLCTAENYGTSSSSVDLYSVFNGASQGDVIIFIGSDSDVPNLYHEDTTFTITKEIDVVGLGNAQVKKKTPASSSNKHLFNCSFRDISDVDANRMVNIANLSMLGSTKSNDYGAVQAIGASTVNLFDIKIEDFITALYLNCQNTIGGSIKNANGQSANMNCFGVKTIRNSKIMRQTTFDIGAYNNTLENGERYTSYINIWITGECEFNDREPGVGQFGSVNKQNNYLNGNPITSMVLSDYNPK